MTGLTDLKITLRIDPEYVHRWEIMTEETLETLLNQGPRRVKVPFKLIVPRDLVGMFDKGDWKVERY